MRLYFVFLIAAFLGVLISATLVHSTFPSVPAPDFILILVVAVSLYYHTPWGVLGAFLLGLLDDFASAQYLGPNAAGCVIAFCLVGLIANRVYADKIVAVFIITFLCSLAKTATHLSLLFIYLNDVPLPENFARVIGIEALITALVSPLVLRVLRGRLAVPASGAKTSAAPVFRWSW